MDKIIETYLNEITSKIGSGSTPRGGSNVYLNKGTSLIRSQNILDFTFSKKGLVYIDDKASHKLDNVIIYENDILLNITGDSIARCCLVPKNILPARVNQHVSIIRCKESDDSEYILYYLQYLKSYLLQICRVGGTRNALTKKSIANLKIYFQKDYQVLAKVLSTLEKKIELNNQINQKLEAMAKTLYDYWFVQFDFPDSDGKPYKSSGGTMVYSEELKREIPEGWEVKELSDIANIIAGGDKPKVFSKNNNFKIPIYSNGVQNNGLYGFTDKARIFKQSITVSARGTIGYCVLRNEPFVPIIRLISITPKTDGTAVFLYYSIKNLVFENSGSVQQQLTVPQVSSLHIILPSKEILIKYKEYTSPIIDKLENTKKETQKLTQLRDWLLPMLMNGQVRVDGG